MAPVRALQRDLRPQQFEKLSHPGRMRGPGRGGHQIALRHRLIDWNIGIVAAGLTHFRAAGRIGRALATLQHARRRKNLRPVAYRRHRLVGAEKMPHQIEHLGVEPQVFGGAPAGDDQRVVVLGLHFGESGVEGEVVAGLFGIGLRALEVVNRGFHLITRLLVGADRVHRVAHGQQGLERHHGFVVFGVITRQQQNAFCSHIEVSVVSLPHVRPTYCETQRVKNSTLRISTIAPFLTKARP